MDSEDDGTRKRKVGEKKFLDDKNTYKNQQDKLDLLIDP